MAKDEKKRTALSRRKFLQSAGVAALVVKGASVAAGVLGGEEALQAKAAASGVLGPGPVSITLNVNGEARHLELEPRVTLLDVLRDRLDLTAAKKVCDRGTCGACTVIVEGQAIYSCTLLAIDAQGRKITRLEGLAPEGQLHAVSAAFVDNDAQQCGFCTPGFVMACKAFLDHHPHPSEADVRKGLGGNLCRCGTYMGVRKAALEAAGRLKPAAAAAAGDAGHSGIGAGRS